MVAVPGLGRRRTLRRARRAAAGLRGRAALRISGRRRSRPARVAPLRVGRSPAPRVCGPPHPSRGRNSRLGGPAALVLAGYLRVLDPGRKFAEPSIGRVLTVAAVSRNRIRPNADGRGHRAHPPRLAGTADPHRGAAASRAVLCEPRLSTASRAVSRGRHRACRHARWRARPGRRHAHLRYYARASVHACRRP